MSAKNTTIVIPAEKITDDLGAKDGKSVNTKASSDAESVDLEKLAKLKAKLEAKKDIKEKVVEKTRSINFGFIGSGQAGARLAQCAYRLGYDSVVINTAEQDLKFIDIPASNKLLLEYSVGGAAKSLEIGEAAALSNREQILKLISNQLADAQMFVFCTSFGGGSGAGSTETVISVLTELQKPILVIGVLPMNSDDFQTKTNSLNILNKLLKKVQSKNICNMIVVDNAKIESIYQNVSQMDFFQVANEAIIKPLHMFNMFSSKPSNVKSLDPMEFVKLLTDGDGLSVYGEFSVKDYQEDTAIAEAIIGNLNNNLLAGGFDIKQSKYVGVMVCAPRKVWDKIPSSSINYAMAVINDVCGTPLGTFKGIYESNDDEDCIKVFSFFSGLGIPEVRVTQLIQETKQHSEVLKTKQVARNLSLNIETDKDPAVTDAQKVKEKIAAKSSTFGKFLQQNVVDRRK